MHMTQTSTGYKGVYLEEDFPPSWLPKLPHIPPQGKHHHPLLSVFLDSVLQATTTDGSGLTGEIKQIGHAGWGEPGQNCGWAEGGLLAYSGGLCGLSAGTEALLMGDGPGADALPLSPVCLEPSHSCGPVDPVKCGLKLWPIITGAQELRPWVECWEDKEISRIFFQKCLATLLLLL